MANKLMRVCLGDVPDFLKKANAKADIPNASPQTTLRTFWNEPVKLEWSNKY